LDRFALPPNRILLYNAIVPVRSFVKKKQPQAVPPTIPAAKPDSERTSSYRTQFPESNL
jgi:hypothetical protein